MREAITEIEATVRSGRAQGQPSRFFFVAGAGVSAPSIPTAAEIVRQLKRGLAASGSGEPQGTGVIAEYLHLFERVFPDPRDRRTFIEKLVKGKPISSATFRLAHLLADGSVGRVVVTTNFDTLLSQALETIDVEQLVIDHPALAERFDADRGLIQLIQLHGTYRFYDVVNLRAEMARLTSEVAGPAASLPACLMSLLRQRAPIVVGYRGWEDDVFMSVLRRRLSMADVLPFNAYWFCHTEQAADQLPDWLIRHVSLRIVVGDATPAGWRQTAVGHGGDATRLVPHPRTVDAAAVFEGLLRALGAGAPIADAQATRDAVSAARAGGRWQAEEQISPDAAPDLLRSRVLEARSRASTYMTDLKEALRVDRGGEYWLPLEESYIPQLLRRAVVMSDVLAARGDAEAAGDGLDASIGLVDYCTALANALHGGPLYEFSGLGRALIQARDEVVWHLNHLGTFEEAANRALIAISDADSVLSWRRHTRVNREIIRRFRRGVNKPAAAGVVAAYERIVTSLRRDREADRIATVLGAMIRDLGPSQDRGISTLVVKTVVDNDYRVPRRRERYGALIQLYGDRRGRDVPQELDKVLRRQAIESVEAGDHASAVDAFRRLLRWGATVIARPRDPLQWDTWSYNEAWARLNLGVLDANAKRPGRTIRRLSAVRDRSLRGRALTIALYEALGRGDANAADLADQIVRFRWDQESKLTGHPFILHGDFTPGAPPEETLRQAAIHLLRGHPYPNDRLVAHTLDGPPPDGGVSPDGVLAWPRVTTASGHRPTA